MLINVLVFQVRLMMKEYPILLMPSHRSYLDFLLMSYVFFHYDLPLPVIAAAMGMLKHFINFVKKYSFYLK